MLFKIVAYTKDGYVVVEFEGSEELNVKCTQAEAARRINAIVESGEAAFMGDANAISDAVKLAMEQR